MPIPHDTIWMLESIRLTVFLAEPASESSDEWWSHVTGSEPETTTTKRQTAERIDDGPLGEARLWLNVNLGPAARVDWVWYPQPSATGEFSSLGRPHECADEFISLLSPWILENCPDLVRIAYSVTLLAPVGSPIEGYQFLQTALPVIKFDLETWSDFTFQVNKKSLSHVLTMNQFPSPGINCVSKWNSVKMMMGLLDSSGGAVSESHAARVELDLSSAVESTDVLPKQMAVSLIDEFRNICDLYMSEGFV